jgi:hypothetical protein
MEANCRLLAGTGATIEQQQHSSTSSSTQSTAPASKPARNKQQYMVSKPTQQLATAYGSGQALTVKKSAVHKGAGKHMDPALSAVNAFDRTVFNCLSCGKVCHLVAHFPQAAMLHACPPGINQHSVSIDKRQPISVRASMGGSSMSCGCDLAEREALGAASKLQVHVKVGHAQVYDIREKLTLALAVIRNNGSCIFCSEALPQAATAAAVAAQAAATSSGQGGTAGTSAGTGPAPPASGDTGTEAAQSQAASAGKSPFRCACMAHGAV